MLVALMAGATGNVWAVDLTGDDIIINKIPADTKDENDQPVVVAGTVVKSVSGRVVTLTVTPKSGTDYQINEKMITVEPMVDPAAAPRRSSILANTIAVSRVGTTDDYTFTLPEQYSKANVTVRFFKSNADVNVTQIFSLTDLQAISGSGSYEIVCDIDASGFNTIASFSGTLTAQAKADGTFPVIMNLTKPLFTTVDGAIINNVILDKVNINVTTSNANVGAIVCEAKGASRIYNCGILSGIVGGTKYVGGLAGLLNGTARVINCYSYANITGGTHKGGIVGYNNVTSTQASLTTMVMNCMFYGDIADGGTDRAPIYGGTEINNVAGGMNTYNYYRYESPYSKNKKVNKYNRALAMEEKFINRFERYRLLLNSNKKLAAKYASTDANPVKPEDMAKWVLETADLTNINPMPYPVLKAQSKYPSIINIDADHAPDCTTVGRLNGGKLGKTLAVTISTKSQKTTGGQSWPTAADSDVQTTSLTLIRTDKDTVRYNFNYDKVQLPYYNDVGTGNYTENRVVTGWKITSITDGTAGTYNAADEWGGYNFADRNCTNKDKYDVSGRVFSQGAYWDVPEGVTAITIEPYWAIANYVSDATYDVVYDKDYNKKNYNLFGQPYEFGLQSNADIDIYGDGKKQKVYTNIASAIANFNNTNKTVYDQAVVLVGNVHQEGAPTSAANPYTLMSIDMNHDNEPDYSYIFGHNDRQPISPIRYDFLNIMGIAEAQMPKGASLFRNVSIFNLKGWFEITNTCVVNFSQFEYDNSVKTTKSQAPLILLGGSFEQFVSTQSSTLDNSTKKTLYIHVGSNAWFAKFGNGTHSDGNKFTPHIPISVTGGDYDEFYLSGTYQPNISNMQADNAECYISGGRFGELAGASLEAIQGDVRWDINWADIINFYGGGVNGVNPITGNIRIDMTNSYVDRYCGGPKFGDMAGGKTVTTNATGCVFGTYFGAGFGGNAYNRVKYRDESGHVPAEYQDLYTTDRGKYYDGSTTNAYNSKPLYGKKGKGVATDFDYEFFVWSSGKTGARFFVKFITFSLATTKNVTSSLKGCTISGNFYGGGNLGKVDGTATSILDDCTIMGNVYGGGFSASIPKVPVRNTPAFVAGKEPSINTNIGLFEMGEINTTEDYEWKHVDNFPANSNLGIESTTEGNFVYTDENLNTLGQVKNSNLIITGSTTVAGDVYGGGALASMETSGETKVNLIGGTINGDVYGGGQGRLAGTKDEKGNPLPEVAALVGNAKVNLNGIDYSADEATQTLYTTNWKLVKDDNITGTPYVVSNGNKGCIVKGSIFGCNNLNGTPKGSVLVHVYKTQNAAKSKVNEKIGIDAMSSAVESGTDLDKLGYWITQAEKNSVDKATIDAAKNVYNQGSGASESDVTAQIASLTTATQASAASHQYDVAAVYGGGNLAAYEPTKATNNITTDDSEAYAEVIIDGCDLTSIRQVYGGGNAASTPATKVTVNGTYEVEELFGGGNGKDQISKDGGKTWLANPGANVGFKDYSDVEDTYNTKEKRTEGELGTAFKAKYVYGSGKASVNIFGGKIHRVFGGSNTKGNVRQTAVTMLDERSTCNFQVDEAYGGGKSAPMDAEAKLLMACIPGLKQAYGGAEAADIQGNVVLNITNGTFDRVFGGNNLSGTIRGSITVNIEEVGCKPIIIGELYGGGNLAGYSIYGYKEVTEGEGESATTHWVPIEDPDDPEALSGNNIYADPQVNVKSFTSIGNIYGGGYGSSAVMVGNPTVEINEVLGEHATSIESVLGEGYTTPSGYPVPPHASGAIGAINNVFGGGNAAAVKGSTTVKIGTRDEWTVTAPKKDTNGKTLYEEDGVTPQTEVKEKDVVGANIVGNVYGGGNEAEVTGNTNVQIGKKM
jgi:hypothetical protein